MSLERSSSQSIKDTRNIQQRREQLRRLSILLDEAFLIPGIRVRIGWDAIIGLLPIIGDAVGAVISSIFILQAIRLGVPFPILLRMVGNIVFESVIGLVPVVGDVFDVAWKANRRNYALIEGYLSQQEAERGIDTSAAPEESAKALRCRFTNVLIVILFCILTAVVAGLTWKEETVTILFG